MGGVLNAGRIRRRFPAVRAGLVAVVAALCLSALSACSTTGQSFHSLALSRIVPGQTTLDQASTLLGAEPVDTYARNDGSVLARWAYKASMVTDAIYARQELWLEFGPDGRFQRVVRKINVPSNPAPPPSAHSAVAASGPSAAPAAPWGEKMDDTVVAYPVGSR